MNHAQDHFTAIAKQYSRGRFGYPSELFRYLRSLCATGDLAWDCATGSGQAAVSLADHFLNVAATDISNELLELAPRHPRIAYRQSAAEKSGLDPRSADLIAVAQAIHWFDLEAFWEETCRVLKPGGVFSFWGYTWPTVSDGIDGVLGELRGCLASHWPERSALLLGSYTALRPPFTELGHPHFQISLDWRLDDYLAHLRSWSAVRYYKEAKNEDIVAKFEPQFASRWADAGRAVVWPLHLRVFRQNGTPQVESAPMH